MELKIVKDYDEMSKVASSIIIEEIKTNPKANLGLATGTTPEGTYKLLIQSNKIGETDWSCIKTFNLDEYKGIAHSHPLSYHTYMNENLFKHINIDMNNVNIPSGENDPKIEGEEYDNKIEQMGGIDLQILGIGQNGHIAFNEPGSSDEEGTREVRLTESTINANSRFFSSKDEVPKKAITMGIKTILKAKKIILLASGESKAEAIKKLFEGPITKDVPASFLRKHPNVTLIIDKKAASLISIK